MGGVAAAVAPDPDPLGTVVVVVVVVGALVVVVVVAAVVGTVVVVAGLDRLTMGAVVVVVVELVVVVAAGTVVVVVGAVDDGVGVEVADPEGEDGVAAVGAAVVMTAFVQAPAFWNVETSATRRTTSLFSSALSDVSVATACCRDFSAASRWVRDALAPASAICECVSRSFPTIRAYWLASTP